MKCEFSIDFQMTRSQNQVLTSYESTSKTCISSFVTLSQFYGPQTKILEGGTKDEPRIFEILFIGS